MIDTPKKCLYLTTKIFILNNAQMISSRSRQLDRNDKFGICFLVFYPSSQLKLGVFIWFSFIKDVPLANDSPYGLQAAVFTNDIATALDVAHRLEVGGVIVNWSSAVRVEKPALQWRENERRRQREHSRYAAGNDRLEDSSPLWCAIRLWRAVMAGEKLWNKRAKKTF